MKKHLNDFVDDLKSKISNLEKEVKEKAEEEKGKAAEKVEISSQTGDKATGAEM
jgi:hypothetical protein